MRSTAHLFLAHRNAEKEFERLEKGATVGLMPLWVLGSRL